MWRVVSSVIGILFAGIVISLAAPRMMASLELLYVQGLHDNFKEKQKLNSAELKRLREGYISSLGYVEQSSVYFSKAALEIELARQEPKKREIWVDEAIASLKNSLSLGPSNPEGWLWLAQLDKIFPQEELEGYDAYVLALLLGPYEKLLVPQYLRYGFDAWEDISQSDRDQLIKLVSWLAEVNLPALVSFAKDKPAYYVKVVNILVADDKKVLRRFVELGNRS